VREPVLQTTEEEPIIEEIRTEHIHVDIEYQNEDDKTVEMHID